MTTTANALSMRGITKSFGDVPANQGIDFDLEVGEIHGLLGENGAGKSTLMNILYGLLSPDAGRIEIFGEAVSIEGPAVALNHGIGMVHQHFMLIPAFTVVENLVLGAEPRRRGVVDTAGAVRQIAEIAERFGLEVSPTARVGDLGVAARQRVEILRALYRGARILILDEPTAVLSPQESSSLLTMLSRMAHDGLSVVLISHKLPELLAVTNRVTVIRDGRVVGTVATAETSAPALATMMVGRSTDLTLNVPPMTRSVAPLLRVTDLGDRTRRVAGVDLDVHGGEIVGIAGVDGSGQQQLVELVCGLQPIGQGRVEVAGGDVSTLPARARLLAGLAYIPEDRSTEGLVLDLPVYENAVLRRQRRSSLRRFGLLSRRRMRARAAVLAEAYDVRPRGVEQSARALSGGNQQKLLVGREMAEDPLVLVVSQPTRGVDVAASNAIHLRLLQARASGRAVLVSSLDLDEIKILCDRVLVMFRGRPAGVLARSELDDRRLGLLLAGGAATADDDPAPGPALDRSS